jgi:hypothetical protein
MGSTVETWTVYQAVKGNAAGIRSVCTDSEWQALEMSHPGINVLVQQGLTHEADAERLARGTSGDSVAKRTQKRVPKPAHQENPDPPGSNPQQTATTQDIVD